MRELRGDRRTPVATVRGERPIAQDFAHQLHPQRSGGAHRDTGLFQRTGKRIARQSGDHHVEGVGRIAAERGGIAERSDHMLKVPERPRPAVREHQRHRVRTLPPHVDVLQRHVVEHDAVVVPLVEGGLEAGEVEALTPVLERLLQPLLVDAVAPVVVAVVAGPAGAGQPVTKVGHDLVGDLDANPLGLHAVPQFCPGQNGTHVPASS